MKSKRSIFLAAALIAGAGCASLDSMQPASETASSTERQILVMLKESSTRHFQPGASYSFDYRDRPASSSQARMASKLAREYGLTLLSDWPMPTIGVRCFLAEVEADQIPAEVVARLAADGRVESAQTVQMFRVLSHNDAYYELQTSAKALNLDELHKMATGNSVRVAQIDTGVDIKHPDLTGQLSQARNFVDRTRYVAELHGTAVAGIIVARADNGVGIVGIAPAATLMPLRACWESTGGEGPALCSSFTLAKALQYALNQQARVVNLSLAGPRDRLLERLIDKAVEQGVTVIGAVDPAAADSFPAAHPRVIAVGQEGAPASSPRTIQAPGERVLTTTPNQSWGFVSGASFATAHVTGITALLLEMSPRLKPQDVSALLNEHFDHAAGGTTALNVCAMLAQFSHKRDCTCCMSGVTPRARQTTGRSS